MKRHLVNAAFGDAPIKPAGERRAFLKKLAAILSGGVAGTVPVAAGLVVVFDPVLREPDNGGFIRVTTLDDLADDGTPRLFQVIDDRVDIWNPYPKGMLGAVYLRKTAKGRVACLSTACPSGGFVEFRSAERVFKCPCHNCTFDINGVRIDPDRCPSPRDIDAMDVDQVTLRRTGEVFVLYRNFKPGTADKLAEE
jgi:menaquinol-cytochrome c reductase iron-sulfur subunit